MFGDVTGSVLACLAGILHGENSESCLDLGRELERTLELETRRSATCWSAPVWASVQGREGWPFRGLRDHTRLRDSESK